MPKSLFWKAVVVIALVAAFYLGRGLHQSSVGAGAAHAADAPKAEAKMPLTWSSVGLDKDRIQTSRAKFKGGWLVYVHSQKIAGTGITGLTFVPDADHSWQP